MDFASITIIALIAVFLFAILYYNRFAVLHNRIENSSAQIDVQLKKRVDLVPNLMETVKGYMKHERGVMNSVTNARKELFSAKGLNNKIKAGDLLGNAISRLFALAENYPKLNSNENFLELQRELSAIEDKIAYARQFYNDSVLEYDNLRSTFPGNFLGKLYGRAEQPYLKIEDSERKPVKVKFD